MINLQSIVVTAPNYLSTDLGGELVLLNLEDGVYYGLNTVGVYIWSLIQQPRTVESICEAVQARFEVDFERCQADVLALLEDLATHTLIEFRDALAS